ncbi:toll-like receptor 3 [Sinocyclocheilus anshuiensis]|uniref:toll-like receptor 3 n=1 Tax=Sinocyclocheilus anshuiensis TaxID=1608454 RepID=UPI0007B791DA|nr:PREDICTED: toll-like receptor 3 [Sinocyclocheilus anshuiensis]
MELMNLILLPLFCMCFHGHCANTAYPHKSTCTIENAEADCSHMNLDAVPMDLPKNITTLDVSHNRLKTLSSLHLYSNLVTIDASYNSLTAIEKDLCLSLPHLQILNVQHNEVYLISEKDLKNCFHLTRLDLSDNRLKLNGEPFSVLKSLTWLDVSRNKLKSAKLGTQPQLPNLITLVLSGNEISVLQKNDFSFLSNSSAFRVLILSSLSLKKVENGCFQAIARLSDLLLDYCKISLQFTTSLCEELAGTALRNLSLKNTQQVTLSNTTFQGLEKTNITVLDLSSNTMSKIAEGAFQWLPRLEILSLEHNTLRHLTKDTFRGLGNLRQLNLQKALIKSHTSSLPIIEDFSFHQLVQLEHLCMANTAFREITEHIFSGLLNLKTLDLSWSITGLKMVTNRTFAALQESPLLQTLNLTAMSINKLATGAFSSLGNLTTLVLGHNFINQQLKGDELQGLSNIKEIDMSLNQQSISLTNTSFIHVPTLRSLKLGRALKGTLAMEASPFRPLVNLTFLDLSNNNIANINACLLKGLYHLKVLKMQHNNLARLWKTANPGGPVLFLQDATKLSVLDLDYNGLDEIPLNALRGLSELRELSLHGNLLDQLHASVFDDLQSLKYLHLQKNLITSVQHVTFGVPLSNLTELYMDHNPFDCTCESILWFSEWLNSTNASIPGFPQSYSCNTPNAYFNRSVMAFDPLSCKDMTPFKALYILSSTAVLMLLFTAFLIHFQGWRIQFFWNIMVNRMLASLEDESITEGRYAYDAYIIHSVEDRPWVERSLLPLEDEKFNFFLEDRDAIPGFSQLDTIVENMGQSRKILFVITEMLLNDPWCRQFKAHHALHQVMEDNRDSLILIFLQDVTDYNLNRSLHLRRGMLKPHCILYWPLHRERIPAFHQKLRSALASTNKVN